MRIIKTVFEKITELLPFAFIFLATFYFPVDSDLGWHLKQGEYFILNKAILDINTLSSAMPNFSYINHSWLFDAATFLIYDFWGFLGLSFFSALFVVLSFYFISKTVSLNLWQKTVVFPLFLWLEIQNFKSSFNIQFFSILLSILLVYLLVRFKQKKEKFIFVLILALMMLWTNAHGQFAVGLVLIGLFTLSYFLESLLRRALVWNTKEDLLLLLLLPFSLIATLINPYGIRIYEVVFGHFLNSTLSTGIYEWQSPIGNPYMSLVLGILVIIALSSILFLFRKKILLNNLFFVLLSILLIIPSFSSLRYLWLAIILTIPLFSIAIKEFDLNSKAIKRIAVGVFLVLYFYVGFLNFPYKSFINSSWKTFCVYQSCSEKAANFIIQNGLNKDLFTTYELGGWLIWNYPEIKPFVDGRMSAWKDEKGYNAFEEVSDYEYNTKHMNDSSFKTVFITKTKPIFDEMEDLVTKNKWKKVYEDFNTAVYTRN